MEGEGLYAMTLQHFLPDFCFNHKLKFTAKGSLVHYFSGRYAFPDTRYDKNENWRLLLDLNRPIDQREWYMMPDMPARVYASYQFMVHRDGEIWQLLPADQVAWHAGESEWKGYHDLNNYFFGVAMIGDGEHPFTIDQYAACASLHKQFLMRYTFDREMITGHENAAPKRKRDPGPYWRWDIFYSLMDQDLGAGVSWI